LLHWILLAKGEVMNIILGSFGGYHNMLVEIFIGTYLTIDDVNRFSLR
jgi:hypothetical protein